jgi:PAS domain S-box-containing protein
MKDPESDRLAELRDLALLDTPPEERFDRLTALAAIMFDAPIALVSLIDQERQWFKSRVGLDATETPRAWAFCDHAIKGGSNATLVVQDATADARFAHNPLVTGDPHIRFYAGAALTTPAGHNLGTLCVIDTEPRAAPSKQDLARLTTLAHVVVDEIELRRTTKALAERQRLLELAQSIAGVGTWRMNVADGSFTWSDEVYRIHGVSRDDYNPNLPAGIDFYHPDDRDTVKRLVERAISHHENFSFRLRLTRSDGELRHVASKAVCELDAAGATTALTGVFQDVTEQVLRVETIQRSEARYRLLTENANDLVTEMGADGRFKYVSPSVTAVTGYAPDEVVGEVALNFIHPDDRARVQAAFAAALAGPPGWQIEYRLTRKDGRVIWVEARPTLNRDPATGRSMGVTDVIRDVTERKALEQALERARVEAESATVVKSEFLSNMSHELRTPLTSIIGFSSIIAAEPGLSDLGRRAVGRVVGSSQALLAIVNDVLDFSRLEAGQVEIAPKPVALGPMLENAVALLEPQAREKALDLAFIPRGELPAHVLLDEGRLRQVLLNLVGNAVKFTAKGAVTVSASYGAETGRLRCEVADTGPGVAAEQLGRLFQRFSQVDASTTRAFGGTGLGLAICKGLVEAMGGEVGVESKVGVGSVFWFELPCPIAANPGAALSPERADAAARLQGLRLLVADDNAVNRELVRVILTPLGVEITAAASGEEAIERALQAPFDLILMDVRMGGVDGPTAARTIRRGEGPNDRTPIIAFSAGADDAPELVGTETLFEARLAKPISPQALVAALACWAAPALADAPKTRTAQ